MPPRKDTSKEYVVVHHAVNVWDPENADDLKHARRERIIRRLSKGDVVTGADLAFADVQRLLDLGSIKEKRDEEPEEQPEPEEPEAPEDMIGVPIPEAEGAKTPDSN